MKLVVSEFDPAREPGGDLLQQPGVAVRVLERGVGMVAAPLRIQAGHRRMSRAVDMEDFAHVDTTADELGARRLDIGDDEKEPARGTWRGRCDTLAEVNRGGGAWRGELHAPERIADNEVGVEPPA